ncbi:hypothetical protein RJ640_003667 [Escallonia rubra]|uniref:C2H2-type domain-containing protein n=1 Tax=Escallonia rubra TaxID=112253 RepID=A0AA88QII1_9ASTE|nr:hypothetical protein RJ640_003667 [Escallonia rubra]
MSNLTSTSNEIGTVMYPQQSSAQPTKKKRNLPGNPDPEAEVIALSPRSLLATNRFICEICNKGFQRDQNLQLHRRGHNLPWKLKQRAKDEVIRKKVYVCPEATCVHHERSRALGDLTGIKKHFSRKHGEKKWKCEKCSKRYAVQSDWKAHSKICGTREYRCDCGTLFSRRDSFITHRAFCDALAEESSRSAIKPNPLLLSSTSQLAKTSAPPQYPKNLIESQQFQPFPLKRELQDLPPWLDQQMMMHRENPNPNFLTSFAASSPHMSATALLQKATQMGVTVTGPPPDEETIFRSGPHQYHQAAHMSSTAGSALGLSSHEEMEAGFLPDLAAFGNRGAKVTSGCMEQAHHDMMTSFPSTSGFEGSTFVVEEDFNGMLDQNRGRSNFDQDTVSRLPAAFSEAHLCTGTNCSREGGGPNDGLTRDFLGLRAFPHGEFMSNMAGLDHITTSSSYHQKNPSQTPWQG